MMTIDLKKRKGIYGPAFDARQQDPGGLNGLVAGRGYRKIKPVQLMDLAISVRQFPWWTVAEMSFLELKTTPVPQPLIQIRCR
jgi:hypothetical protein